MRAMMYPLILILLVLTAGCGTETKTDGSDVSNKVEFEKDDYKKIANSSNQLGFDLLPEVNPQNGNTFISPVSLMLAVSMLYNGADGVTKQEIANVLHAEGMDAKELNEANASLLAILQKDTDAIQLNIANSIWLNDNYRFQSAFSANNKDYFNAEIQEIDVMDKKSAQMINDWVKESTNGKIEKITESPLKPNLVTMLMNAIYFKGSWTNQFNKDWTAEAPFHSVGKEETVQMMRLNEELDYMENDSFQAVSLPYGDDEKMSMEIFLPKEHSNLEDFQKMLTKENWEKWRSEFHKREGSVMLPRFKLEYEEIFNDSLVKLGMKSAFSDSEADLSKMVEEDADLYVSEVKQKTFLEVNEEGAEAAAVTAISVLVEKSSAESFHMEVNRPFFIAITDKDSGLILFMGAIANPDGK